MKSSSPRLFCFGLGYSARRLARGLMADGWTVAGTCREDAAAAELCELGVDAHVFDRARPLTHVLAALEGATHLLSSVPPDEDGDPVLDCCAVEITAVAGNLQWAGYLSTTGVYGNRDGGMVAEGDELRPTSVRAKRRAVAEARWLALAAAGVPVHAFRLAGIYGPGRNILEDVKSGRAKNIQKSDHVFSRIHVDDIANVVRASMARPNPGAVYNVCDDTPASPSHVVAYAAELLGQEPPPAIPYGEAEKTMSEMSKTFWADNKRVDNRRIKEELGVDLKYPGYREGLRGCFQDNFSSN